MKARGRAHAGGLTNFPLFKCDEGISSVHDGYGWKQLLNTQGSRDTRAMLNCFLVGISEIASPLQFSLSCIIFTCYQVYSQLSTRSFLIFHIDIAAFLVPPFVFLRPRLRLRLDS